MCLENFKIMIYNEKLIQISICVLNGFRIDNLSTRKNDSMQIFNEEQFIITLNKIIRSNNNYIFMQIQR